MISRDTKYDNSIDVNPFIKCPRQRSRWQSNNGQMAPYLYLFKTFFSQKIWPIAILQRICQTSHSGTCTNAKNLYLYNDPVLSNDHHSRVF